jgi:hypothetical protein
MVDQTSTASDKYAGKFASFSRTRDQCIGIVPAVLLIRIDQTPPVRVMTYYEITSRRAGGGPAANSDRLKSISGRVAKIESNHTACQDRRDHGTNRRPLRRN